MVLSFLHNYGFLQRLNITRVTNITEMITGTRSINVILLFASILYRLMVKLIIIDYRDSYVRFLYPSRTAIFVRNLIVLNTPSLPNLSECYIFVPFLRNNDTFNWPTRGMILDPIGKLWSYFLSYLDS